MLDMKLDISVSHCPGLLSSQVQFDYLQFVPDGDV